MGLSLTLLARSEEEEKCEYDKFINWPFVGYTIYVHFLELNREGKWDGVGEVGEDIHVLVSGDLVSKTKLDIYQWLQEDIYVPHHGKYMAEISKVLLNKMLSYKSSNCCQDAIDDAVKEGFQY